jgi:hypothetical protein
MRMKVRAVVWAAACGILGAALPALAHHAFSAEYDRNRPIEVTGTVTRVDWMNPHAHFFLEVKGAGGSVAVWDMELASPNVLVRNGWKRDSLKKGDVVTVTGSGAKDGSNTGNAANILFPDGRRLGFLSAEDDR